MTTSTTDREAQPVSLIDTSAAEALGVAGEHIARFTIDGRRRRGLRRLFRLFHVRKPQTEAEDLIRGASRTAQAPAWLTAEGVDVLDIEVTQADIDQGRRCVSMWCMVAVATRRQLGLHERRRYTWARAWDDRRNDARLWVGPVPGDDRWRIRHRGAEYLLPREVGAYIESWDVGSAAYPFRFRAVRRP